MMQELYDLKAMLVKELTEYGATVFVCDEKHSQGNWHAGIVFDYYSNSQYAGTKTGRKADWTSSIGYFDCHVFRIETHWYLGDVPVPGNADGIYWNVSGEKRRINGRSRTSDGWFDEIEKWKRRKKSGKCEADLL